MKLPLLIVLTSLTAISASDYTENDVNLNKMEIIDSDGEYKSKFPEIFGARSCGGQGKFISLRFEGCESEEYVCEYPTDGRYRTSELEFEPSKDFNGLGKRVVFLVDGTSQMAFEAAIVDSYVKAGKRVILKNVGHIGKDLKKGQRVTLQYFIYRVGDYGVEICQNFDFLLV